MFNWFFCLFVFLFLADIGINFYLDTLNLSEIEKNKNNIPSLFKGKIDQTDYTKSIAYSKAKTHFNWAQLAFQLLLVGFLILSGFFGHLDVSLQHTFSSKWALYLAYPTAVAGIFYLFSLPFSIYFQFNLEDKFGFNKMAPSLFAVDQLKTIVVVLALALPLMALLFYLVEKVGTYWWVAGFGVLIAFQFLAVVLFPVVFAPLFYKFTPLEEGNLKNRIETLASELSFEMAGIYTIDGSKRSSHSNAFFAGMGKTRRIVLFDTLRDQMSTDEIVAVIAHEIGHNKENHIKRQFMLSALMSFIMMFFLGLCLKWPTFFHTFGVNTPSIYAGFTLFFLFFNVFTFPLTPAINYLSRKYEYEADAFSIHTTKKPEHMVSALVNLSRENLSNLTPHPLYSFFHYSHPTTIERVKAINLHRH